MSHSSALSPFAPAAASREREHVLGLLRERIMAYAASRCGKEVAEDLAQEALMVLHEKYPRVERLEELVPLAITILRFKMVAHWRKVARRGETTAVDPEESGQPSHDPDPEARLAGKELLKRLMEGLGTLGPRCQELFRLKLQGRSFPEIRGVLGAETVNTVYTWDHRCRKALLEWLGGRWA